MSPHDGEYTRGCWMYKTASTGTANSAIVSAINGLSTKWAKRWVWVSSTELFYSEHPTPQPQNSVHLADITSAKPLTISSMERKSAPKELRMFGWILQTKSKEICWAAPDAATRDRFVAFLTQYRQYVSRGRPTADDRAMLRARLSLVSTPEDLLPSDEDDDYNWPSDKDDNEKHNGDSDDDYGEEDDEWDHDQRKIKSQLDKDVRAFIAKGKDDQHGIRYSEMFTQKRDENSGQLQHSASTESVMSLHAIRPFLAAMDNALVVEERLTGCAVGTTDGLVIRQLGTVDCVRYARCARIANLCCKLQLSDAPSEGEEEGGCAPVVPNSRRSADTVSLMLEEETGRCTLVTRLQQFVTVQVHEGTTMKHK